MNVTSKDKCYICLEEQNHTVINLLPCKHYICESCYNDTISQYSQKCQFCNDPNCCYLNFNCGICRKEYKKCCHSRITNISTLTFIVEDHKLYNKRKKHWLREIKNKKKCLFYFHHNGVEYVSSISLYLIIIDIQFFERSNMCDVNFYFKKLTNNENFFFYHSIYNIFRRVPYHFFAKYINDLIQSLRNIQVYNDTIYQEQFYDFMNMYKEIDQSISTVKKCTMCNEKDVFTNPLSCGAQLCSDCLFGKITDIQKCSRCSHEYCFSFSFYIYNYEYGYRCVI